jgi:hypothetical protein
MDKKLDDILLDINGKDDRLKILQNSMTKYGCRVKPYRHISYSSCTASTISQDAYRYTDDYLANNIDLNNNLIDEFQKIRDDLCSVLGLENVVDICLSSSGTDLEMLPYMCIQKNSSVCNIIVGVDEVGSGTLLSAEGRLFSDVISKESTLQKGDKLDGFEKYDIEIAKVPIRDKEGTIISEESILNNIYKIIEESTQDYIIVHSVFHSKTGLITPSPYNLLKLTKSKKNCIIVVDACQFRVSKDTVDDLLKKGCIVFITGSKFFSGPTFSAAGLIPNNLKDSFAKSNFVASGINFLFGKELFPDSWSSVDNFEYQDNLGLLLRWRASIYEMRLFNTISKDKIIKTIEIFNRCINKIENKYSNIVVYSDTKVDTKEPYDLLMSKTIVTFGFDSLIDFDTSKKIYQKLISNDWLDEEYPYSVHLGQPVKIKKVDNKWLGNLRIALGSRFFVNFSNELESIQESTISKELDYIFRAIKKVISL